MSRFHSSQPASKTDGERVRRLNTLLADVTGLKKPIKREYMKRNDIYYGRQNCGVLKRNVNCRISRSSCTDIEGLSDEVLRPQESKIFGKLIWLGSYIPDVFGTVHLLYQLLQYVPLMKKRLVEGDALSEDLLEQDSDSSAGSTFDSPPDKYAVQQNELRKRTSSFVLTSQVGTCTLSSNVKRSEEGEDGFLADDELDNDEDSSGFFSDDVSVCSETDSDVSTADKQTQCNFDYKKTSHCQCLHLRSKEKLVVRKSERCIHLLKHCELPSWLQNNDYLIEKHRPPLRSYSCCLKSIFMLHSETGNIWTHLLGSIGFAIFGLYFFLAPVLPLDWMGTLVFSTFFIGAVVCLGLSAMYHTFNCHSQNVCDFFCKMDYCGITILILGSFYPWLYFQFLCDPIKRTVYAILVTVSGLLTMKVAMSEEFGKPCYRGLRAGIFFGFALVCGILPSSHYAFLHGWFHMLYDTYYTYILVMMAMYVTGACIYASRIPERYLPGGCDVFFQSHQIFHVFVIFGALVHYYCIYKVAHLRISEGQCSTGTSSILEAIGL